MKNKAETFENSKINLIIITILCSHFPCVTLEINLHSIIFQITMEVQTILNSDPQIELSLWYGCQWVSNPKESDLY